MVGSRVVGVVVGLVLLASAAGCSSGTGDTASGSTGGGSSQGKSSGGAVRTTPEGAPASLHDAAPAPMGRPSAADLPSVGPSVIKTATLDVSVGTDIQHSVQQAVAIAGRYGGFVSSSSLESGQSRSGTVVLRVPADRFEIALADLEALGDVRRENVSGEDVGQELVDLQARLRNWQAQEAVLLRLMDRARSVADTIRVQGELSGVQLEIERIRGRLSYLGDQTAMATVTATFTGGALAPAQPPGTLAKAWAHAVAASLAVVSAVIVAGGFVLPLALLGALVLVVVRQLRPRLDS